MSQPGIGGGDVPDGVVDATLEGVEVQSSWDKPNNRGCELSIALSSGRRLYVICLGIDDVERTLAQWRDRAGARIVKATPVVSVTLADGGQQLTLDLHWSDGHRCEGDLLEVAKRDEGADLETEWTFEGRPGEEMGER